MRRRQIKFEHDEDDDPMSVVSNLFDAAMVFAVALMVALVTHYKMTEMFSTENFTVVKNPGKQNMEIISKKGKQIERYTPSKNQLNRAIKVSVWAQPTSLRMAKLYIFQTNNHTGNTHNNIVVF